jgi:hypothetical protein
VLPCLAINDFVIVDPENWTTSYATLVAQERGGRAGSELRLFSIVGRRPLLSAAEAVKLF